MADPRPLLRALAEVDRRAAVWAACQCARTVLHLVPEGEDRPRLAIETAEAWTRGEATADHLSARINEASAAYVGATSISLAAANAAYAAYAAAAATTKPSAYLHLVVDAGAEGYGSTAGAAWRPRAADYLAHLDALVRAIRWPRTLPTHAQILAAPGPLAVAWDAVCEIDADLTLPELVEAHARAERLGLDWGDPVARAVAERATDEGWIGALGRCA